MVIIADDIAKENKKIEERELINKSLSGNHLAFSVLYYRYHHQIYVFCNRLLYGKGDLEDVVQQVFLEAWRSLKHFEGRSLFSTWLTRVAIHTCLSYRRKQIRIILNNTEDIDNYQNVNEKLWGENQVLPDYGIFLEEQKNLINEVLSRMTPRKKIVFVLSDIEGMSAPEISKILNIPDATVRTRLFHARKEFAQVIHRNKIFKEALAM